MFAMRRVSAEGLRVDETLAFIESHLRLAAARILDAGCGAGRLVARLSAAGHDALGVDASPEAVEAARAAGRAVVLGDFLEHRDGPYDAIVFGGSLHHMHPLDRAVAHAVDLLRPAGLLIADEFDLEAPDTATALWFFDVVDVLEASGLTLPPDDADEAGHERPGPAADPLDRWRERLRHDPPLARGREMRAAISQHLEVDFFERCPYLYWYFCRSLDHLAAGREIAERLLALERRLIGAGRVRPVGLRIVAKRAEPAAAPA